ncbi:hypothetical protein M409DRAFT_50093 [Zasmidium cellare ATCC 36951]|uniref:BRCT domain-containing protein n=1 Tax=Zasmidium cellare ATCC 36951 TaxID=1080233 RepID=A0A6A6CZC1_ZASCE|nr:uncharacterized protein M409DRAFT_50093 [Zasmidium cellare ATCC 36951]KAF2172385.1 hypothetical protein M409DRAFT_50093 [Zasmidium cellare ATCC 36951]
MLRCMSTSCQYIADLVLPAAATHLVRESTGRFSIRQNIAEPEKILARIEQRHLSLYLETAFAIVLEPRPGAYLTPASSTTPQGHVLLSDGDCLHFTEHYLKVLYTTQQPTMPPLPSSPVAEARDSPPAKEDSETEASDDGIATSPTAEKALGNSKTSTTKHTTNSVEADDVAPDGSASKEITFQDTASDSEVMMSTPKPHIKYGKKDASRRAKSAIPSDATEPTSSAVAKQAATLSVRGSIIPDDDADTDSKSITSNGKLSAVKRGTKRKAPPRPKSAEDTYRVSTEDDDPPPKKARLPKAAREETPGEEIAVATRSVQKTGPQRSSGRESRATSGNDSPISTPSSLVDTPSKVLITMCNPNGKIRGWFKRKMTVVEEIPGKRTNFVCVTRHKDLPTTAKILKTLVAGKPVLSVQWIIDSHREGTILDPSSYKHSEVEGSDEANDDRRSLFKGKTLFFTNAAVNSYNQGWDAIKEVAQEAGATAIQDGTATKGNELTPKHNVLLFGDGPEDGPARTLIKEHGRTVYDKAMFAQAIIRAELDLDDDEFKLKGSSSDTKATANGRRKR